MGAGQDSEWSAESLDEPMDADLPVDEEPATGRSHLISKVLSPAVRLWLRSQVEHVDDLQFQIEGGDRQLISGYIPQVSISAQNAIYQGLHLSEINLVGSNIRINLGQIWRGKPLRLLQVVPIEGELVVQQAAFNASLQSPLLGEGLVDFIATLLRVQSDSLLDIDQGEPLDLQAPQVLFAAERATLSVKLISKTGEAIPVIIRTGVKLVNPNTLALDDPQWLTRLQANRGLPLKDLQDFEIDLGSDVHLHELSLEQEQIRCRGRINVIPA